MAGEIELLTVRQLAYLVGHDASGLVGRSNPFTSPIVYSGGAIGKFGAITGGTLYTPGTQILSLTGLVGGTLYVDGVYSGVTLSGGAGTSITANIIVFGGIVVSCAIVGRGTGSLLGDVLSCPNTSLGGAGSGFSITVGSVGYIAMPLTGGSGTGATANIVVSAGGVVTSCALVGQGINFLVNDVISAAIPGGSGFSIPVSAVGGLSAAALAPQWYANAVTGISASLSNTIGNFFQFNDGVDASASSNGMRQFYWQGVTTSTIKGGRTLGFMDLQLNGADVSADRFYQTFQPNLSVNVNLGGTAATPLGHAFVFNPTLKINTGATNLNAGIVAEFDAYIAAGASALDFGFQQNVIQSLHASPGVRQNFGTLYARAVSTVPGIQTIIQDGAYAGYPILSTTGSIFAAYPHANSGNAGTIGNGFDLSNYAAISGNILLGPQSNGFIDGSFNISANKLTLPAGTAPLPDLIVGNATTGLYSVSTTGLGFSINGVSGFDYGVSSAAALTTNVMKVTGTGGLVLTNNAGTLLLRNAGTVISSPANATLQLGAADATSPIAQMLQAQSVLAGNANVAGATLTIAGSKSNGSGGGDVILETTLSSASSGVQNALAAALTLKGGTQRVQFNSASSFSANGSVATSLGSVGPIGANTTVQEWLTILDSAGTARYIPCF